MTAADLLQDHMLAINQIDHTKITVKFPRGTIANRRQSSEGTSHGFQSAQKGPYPVTLARQNGD